MGNLCIRGLRITVSDVIEYLASGMTEDEIVSDFPELTKDDIHNCRSFAADREEKLSAPLACGTVHSQLAVIIRVAEFALRRWLRKTFGLRSNCITYCQCVFCYGNFHADLRKYCEEFLKLKFLRSQGELFPLWQ